MRRPHRRGVYHAVFHHTGREKSLDEIEDVSIRDHVAQTCQDHVKRDVVEKSLNVGVEYETTPGTAEFGDLLESVVTRFVRPETVGLVVEQRFEQGVQQPTQHFLCHAIADGGNAQRAFLATPLVDVLASRRQGLKSPRLEFPHQPFEVLFEVGLEHLDADTIDSGGPAVLANSVECVAHDSERDPSGQRVMFDLERLGAVHPVIPESGLCRSVDHTGPWKMLLRTTRGDG